MVRGTSRRRRVVLPIALTLLALAFSCGEIRADELLCEEAVVRLSECCPGFDPRRVNCLYVNGCSGSARPNFSERTSECIRARSCDALRTQGACERVSSSEPDAVRGEGTSFDREVCQ